MSAVSFRLQSQCVHLTYKGHLDVDLWKAHFYPKHGDPKLFSFVHESSDKEVAYDHTHVCVEWIKNFDSTNARVYDFDDIHPHIQKVISLKHKKTIVVVYHWKAPRGPIDHGDDFKDKDRFAPEQFGCDPWRLEESQWQIAEEAPTLKLACQALGIHPKTLAEVEKVRQEFNKMSVFATPAEGVDTSQFKNLEWPKRKALVLRGPSGIGKTQWAIAQFHNPIMIEDLDDLKNIPKECDGLVFDEIQFDMLSKAKKIALTDWEMARTVRIRHTLGRIPRHVPKIFCCNAHEHTFGLDSHASVLRRIVTIDVNQSDLRH